MEYDGGFGRHAANVTVYSQVARAGPHHRTNGLGVLVFVDRLHRDLTTPLTTPANNPLTKGHK